VFLSNHNINELFQTAYLFNLHGLHKYNQKFGWKAGDKVLEQMVTDISLTIKTDMIFRLHGDKFIILLEQSIARNQLDLPQLHDGLHISHHCHHLIKNENYSIDTLMTYFYQQIK